jgi:brefeldin A-inhibited guanine nucleotide-exchange protein
MAFQTVVVTFSEHYEVFHETAFVDGVNCLVEYACNRAYPGMAMEAVDMIHQCVERVAGEAQAQAGEAGAGAGEQDDGEKAWVQGWFPLLFGLHRIMTRCQLDVRTRALTVLIDAIKQYGRAFEREHWQDLFRITFRIFDELKLPENQADRVEWLNTTCNHALFAVLEVFAMYYAELHDVVYDDLLATIRWCAAQDNEILGRSATQSLQVLLLGNGRRMDAAMWDKALDTAAAILRASTPDELFAFTPAEVEASAVAGTPLFSFHAVIIKCVVQLEMVEALEMVVLQETLAEGKLSHGPVEQERDPKNGMYEQLADAQIVALADMLHQSYAFARKFNADHALRMALWKAGFMKQLPNLVKQETTALHAALAVLFRAYTDPHREGAWPGLETRLLHVATQVLRHFLELTGDKQRETWAPLLLLLLENLNRLDKTKVRGLAVIG